MAAPLEQAINGVEGMLYSRRRRPADGVMTLTVTFTLGTDVDKAQVLVQNRVAQALPRLPAEVQRLGVTTTKASPDLTMVVHLTSPDEPLRHALPVATTPRCTSRTRWRGSTASATCRCSARATTPCASGSNPDKARRHAA